MIERNFRNSLIWEEPDGVYLDLSPRTDSFDRNEIRQLFTVVPSNDLAGENEIVASQADVKIECIDAYYSVYIDLVFRGTPPYKLTKDGVLIENKLDVEDFPYADIYLPDGSSACYQIEDDSGTTHEVCCDFYMFTGPKIGASLLESP